MDLDPNRLGPQVYTLLMGRGMGLPVLQWSGPCTPQVRASLESGDNKTLLEPHRVHDEQMAAAVRAMLMLWHGMPSEAEMFASAGPEAEGQYITGLARRHAGKLDESKEAFQQLQGHAVFASLCSQAVELIGPGMHSSVKRFGAILQQNGDWESFAFTDLWAMAKEGQFSLANEEVIRTLQFEEFKMLFAHCYKAATNMDITKAAVRVSESRQDSAALRRARREKLKARNDKPLKARTPATPKPEAGVDRRGESKGQGESSRANPALKTSEEVVIRCPRCKAMTKLPLSARGQKQSCKKCGAKYMVPGGGVGAGGMPAADPSKITVACPSCRSRMSFPKTARGKRVQCVKCLKAFAVPVDSKAA